VTGELEAAMEVAAAAAAAVDGASKHLNIRTGLELNKARGKRATPSTRPLPFQTSGKGANQAGATRPLFSPPSAISNSKPLGQQVGGRRTWACLPQLVGVTRL